MRTALTRLLGVELPIVQAPMAGAGGAALAAAVSAAGGLGSLPAALLDGDGLRGGVAAVRAATDLPINVNFFCHAPPATDTATLEAWRGRLAAYATELGVELPPGSADGGRLSFDGTMAAVVEELRPEVVSFHFGLPAPELVARVHATGAVVMSSATSVREARWLVDGGCDVVIAQGLEAGGHRAVFLDDDVSGQVTTMALVPQVVDAVAVPVIAAGGITDARGIVAALALGAAGVQMGTAFLRCPEATIGPLHRAALEAATDDATVLTNVLTGRPARSIRNRVITEVGPLAPDAPPFPLAMGPLAALRASAEAAGSPDFTPLWSGQAAPLARDLPAGELVRLLGDEADALRRALAGQA